MNNLDKIIVLLIFSFIVYYFFKLFTTLEFFENNKIKTEKECDIEKVDNEEIYKKNIFNKSNKYVKYAKFHNDNGCTNFINEAINGKYDKKYHECYSKCLEFEPDKDSKIYCGNGSECDAFCHEVS